MVAAWVERARSRSLAVPSPDYWFRAATLAGAYVAAAKFGIGLSVANGVITPVWAPTGISLAALLLFGRRLWPAVAAGAFIANATSGAGLLVAAGITVGNTLEAVVGATLLLWVGFRLSLDRVRDVLALVVLGAGVSTLVSATSGTSVVNLAGQGHGSYGSQWLLWWFGDAVGDLMIVPLLLVAHAHRRQRPSAPRLLEALVLLGALVGVGAIVFLAGEWRYPYLLFPLLLWATLRFRQLGAAASSFVVTAMGTWGTVEGTLPIASTSPTTRVQIIQALVGVVSISLLVLGATLAEREKASADLRQAADRLSEAQALTHIGSWEWDIGLDRVVWSHELYRIYGLPVGTHVTYDAYIGRIHPEDRELVEAAVKDAYENHRPFKFEHRIVLPDGATRLVEGRGQVVLDESGTPVRMVGTSQDITDQRRIERLRDDILATVSHEFRTPLAAVVGFSSVLQERWEFLDEEARARAIGHIAVQARRLERLLSDLLDLDRLRQGIVTPIRKDTDVRQLIEHVAEAHRTHEHPVEIEADPITAHVDRPKVERIVDNLLANALKHTPRGTAVAVRVERQGDDLLIVVDDEGPGVPDEFKMAVFDVFDRGRKAMSAETGAGVGLSVVARFAELHEGRAWVEDRDGRGASFRVLLPRCVVPDAALLDR